ncbi:nitrate/sulfonate/bicarbonate ABC transporter permease [Halalkalibacter akibai JCM 9157]|uniref:Nitrate/sulfonate/bicarbonate ABC transporter permease n=1 Tax=Halalkalibacter akibai (strain ATCC 43226 / DSM 21942 / CIP 109018 / JCM 9157 / 1139) TaxID=1236973 RepID=W4QLY4_HALA3|nr:nitrate/sulfonate/bicarbonate ABC transporter permease [Halalkalibacter akibai JCM 9157]
MSRQVVNSSSEISVPNTSNSISFIKKKGFEWMGKVLPPVIALIVFVAMWQIIVTLIGIPHYILPKPTDIVEAAVKNWANLSSALVTTIVESVLGFVFSLIGGIALPY